MLNAIRLKKMQAIAANEESQAAKRLTALGDNEQRQKYSKTDIEYISGPQTLACIATKEKQIPAPTDNDVSHEVAKTLLSLRSEINNTNKGEPRDVQANKGKSGSPPRSLPTYVAPYRKGSRHVEILEEKSDDKPRPTDLAWTIPQRKQDDSGQEYYSTGKMNGSRNVWTTKYPAWQIWLPQKVLEGKIKREIRGPLSLEKKDVDRADEVISENGIFGDDENSDEDREQRVDFEDTMIDICGGLKRKWKATDIFQED
jgi:hypothetical protein